MLRSGGISFLRSVLALPRLPPPSSSSSPLAAAPFPRRYGASDVVFVGIGSKLTCLTAAASSFFVILQAASAGNRKYGTGTGQGQLIFVEKKMKLQT